jgi:hypothetical protein
VAAERKGVVSSFTMVKGAMISETYAVFSAWDFELSKKENLDILRRDNSIGAKTATWLRDVAKVLNRRFDPAGRDRPLVLLAQHHCDLDVWKPLLLWHITRDEFLLRDFLLNWLYPRFDDGTLNITAEEIVPYLRGIGKHGGTVEHAWTEATVNRVAAGLLKIAADFGLLTGVQRRQFAPYHLPDPSFLYILHALRDQQSNPAKLVSSPEWRMYLMRPSDVDRELLRLHQFRRLDYHVAGSLVQLKLPCAGASQYAEGMVA